MSKTKQCYHSELASLNAWLPVTVTSDVITSKFQKDPTKAGFYFCEVQINGEQRNIVFENNDCASALRGRKGQTLNLYFTGSRDSARIEVDPNAPAARAQAPAQQQAAPPPQAPPPQQAPPPPPPPAAHAAPSQQRAAAPSKYQPLGATVGMAINNACLFMTSSGEPFSAKRVTQISSDILRVARWLETGNLLPAVKSTTAEPAATTPQTPPAATTPPPPPPPADPPPPAAEDDVPF